MEGRVGLQEFLKAQPACATVRGGHLRGKFAYKPDTELAFAHIPRRVTVRAVWIGEGMEGDYSPDNPDDIPLVRLEAERPTRRTYARDVITFCTFIDARTDPRKLQLLCERIATLLAASPRDTWCRIMAAASWLDARDVDRILGLHEKPAPESLRDPRSRPQTHPQRSTKAPYPHKIRTPPKNHEPVKT